MKKYLSTILISFIVFVNLFTPLVGFKIALAGNEEININLTPKSSSDLGVSIDGLFKTDDKVGSISVAYFVSKNSNDLENNGLSMGGNGLDEIKKYSTSTTEGKTIYNYEIHKQVTQYSQNPNYYDFVKGDTYFIKVMVFKPTTGGVDVKYSSKVFEFKAGEQSSVVIAANQNSQTQTNTNKTQTTTNNCTITSASWDPWGEQGDDFYKDKTTTANILVKSKNCVGVAGVKLTITEEDKLVSILSDQLDNSGLYKKPINIPSDNFAVNIQLGEEDCDSGIGYDCNLYFKFEKDGEEIFNSSKNNNGRLYYECDLTCWTNAKFLGIINQGSEDQPVDVALKVGMTENRTRYNFLAPIGKIVCMDWGENADGKCLGNNIGDYLNFIFKIGIGVSAALAVIMIIIAGITYMGDESVFGKTEAKSKMFSAIGGLIIAIGAWALLNTINPDLTGSGGLNVDGVNIEVVRSRIDDPNFINNISSIDTSNITALQYSDALFLGYMSHQQGSAGLSAILWANKNGHQNVPTKNPFTKSDVNKNMQGNFPTKDAIKVIGTSVLTPANFLKYWSLKIAAVQQKTNPPILPKIDTALQKVSSETGINTTTLKTICRIESGCTTESSITVVNSGGYSGLFQISNDIWIKYKNNGTNILDAHDNALAAALYYKDNLSAIQKNVSKINK